MNNKILGNCVYCGKSLFSESIHTCAPQAKQEQRKCDNCGEFGACCQRPKQEQSKPVQEPHWYFIDKTGVATLCTDEDDAKQGAKLAAQAWPRFAPYRAVQLCEYIAPQQRKPQFKEFVEWANSEGYDTAHAHDGVKWICLNPMTNECWKAWQAANGIKGVA
jgi:hypothetical protein